MLDTIFDEFSSLWMSMKVQVKTKEDHEAQQYKFRPRAFKIDSIIQVDISTLRSSVGNAAFSEWQEMISAEEEIILQVRTILLTFLFPGYLCHFLYYFSIDAAKW